MHNPVTQLGRDLACATDGRRLTSQDGLKKIQFGFDSSANRVQRGVRTRCVFVLLYRALTGHVYIG